MQPVRNGPRTHLSVSPIATGVFAVGVPRKGRCLPGIRQVGSPQAFRLDCPGETWAGRGAGRGTEKKQLPACLGSHIIQARCGLREK